MKKFSIRTQEAGKDTQIAETDTLPEALDTILNQQGSYGNACIVIMNTESGKYVVPTQKMLRKLYKSKR